MKMLRIPSFTDPRGNIEAMDLKDVLSAKGCAMISALPAEQSSTPKLIDSFKNGIFARQDDRMVQYIALSMASEIIKESMGRNSLHAEPATGITQKKKYEKCMMCFYVEK